MADRPARNEKRTLALERVALQVFPRILRGDRLGPRLYDIDEAVTSVLRPFDILGHRVPGFARIVVFDGDSVAGKFQNLGIGEAVARPVGARGVDELRAHLALLPGIDELHFLCAE